MRITKTVRLSQSDLLAFGVLMTCSCGKPQWITNVGSNPFDVWSCDWCNRPLVVISRGGKMHLVGEKALDRRVVEGG